MIKEDKDLLLKDLCARLPYGVKCKVSYNSGAIKDKDATLYGIDKDGFLMFDEIGGDHREFLCKPYLFPLSSMTEEQKEEFYKFFEEGITESANETRQWLKTKRVDETRRPITIAYVMVHELVIDWCNKNHFDYRGLIPMGSAIDATGLNIY